MIIELLMTITLAQSKAKQPECKPEPPGVNVTATSVNGIPYVCKDGKWIVHEGAMKEAEEESSRRRELVWAARSRLLTSTEMHTLKGLGNRVFSPAVGMWTISENEAHSLDARLNALLLQQFEMRLIAERGCKPKP